MAIFIKYGSNVGEATAEGYKEWIEVDSFQWGVGRGISSPVGGSSKRESSAPSVSEITVTKTMDKASPLMLKEAIGGKGSVVKIELTRTDEAGKHLAYQKYILTDTLVSGYSLSSGGDRPSESLSLNFVKIDSEYIAIDNKGGATTTGHVIYDLSQAKMS
jgi:type VI secretion system secreted protein Hcp